MAYNKNEKTLAADVKIPLLDAFEKQWKSRGQVQKRAVTAALHLWISLPEELQARLISQELGENNFFSLVRQIVHEHIQLNCPALSKKGNERDKYSQHTGKLDF